MKEFSQEFTSLNYVLRNSNSVLLIAHNNPDADTVGSTVALQEILISQGKKVDIICNDPFPDELSLVITATFYLPKSIPLEKYDAVIACDSVDRGPFQNIQKNLLEKQVTVLIDHHSGIEASADILLIDARRSSTCEILYEFFVKHKIPITTPVATALLLGLLYDTGNFQHPCTSTRVLEIASDLLKKGAPLQKIIPVVSSNRKISTLHLWGKAFDKMRIIKKTGMAVTALTEEDLKECSSGQQETPQIAQILSTIPGVRYGLVLHQKDNATVRGSFRAQESAGIDVCALAKKFGGGGHILASGFEIPGVIQERNGSWIIQ